MSNSSTAVTTTLDRMQVGESALVFDVSGKDSPKQSHLADISRRLKELGFVRGEEVTILHKGYFGGEPLAVRVGQSTFALRNFEAALIGVTKSDNPA
jgi:ferrous iron transport protein A